MLLFKKIDQSASETPASNEGEVIDDFCLWGSRADAGRWVSTFQTAGWPFKVDMISTPTTLFSQRAEPLAVVVGDFHETPHQTGDNTDFPQSVAKKRSEAAPRVSLARPA